MGGTRPVAVNPLPRPPGFRYASAAPPAVLAGLTVPGRRRRRRSRSRSRSRGRWRFGRRRRGRVTTPFRVGRRTETFGGIAGGRNGVHQLLFGEILRAFDMRHETHEHSVAEYLRIEPRSTIGVPDRLDVPVDHDTHTELIDTHLGHMSHHPTGAQCRYQTSGTFRIHGRYGLPVPRFPQGKRPRPTGDSRPWFHCIPRAVLPRSAERGRQYRRIQTWKGTVVTTIFGRGRSARRSRPPSGLCSRRCRQWRTTISGRMTVMVRSGRWWCSDPM